MPNLNIRVEEAVLAPRKAHLVAALPGLRAMLCRELRVDAEACQIAILPMIGLPDQPVANVEMLTLPKPDPAPPG